MTNEEQDLLIGEVAKRCGQDWVIRSMLGMLLATISLAVHRENAAVELQDLFAILRRRVSDLDAGATAPNRAAPLMFEAAHLEVTLIEQEAAQILQALLRRPV